MSIRLEAAFGMLSNRTVEMWERLHAVLRESNTLDEWCVYYEKRYRVNDLAAIVRRRGKPYFDVEVGELNLSYFTVASADHALVQITGIPCLSDCDVWIAALVKASDFRIGWAVDDDYNYWQNAFDPLQYTSRGRSYEGLPMKSNNAPPPLEQTIIDTSQNPGRRIIRQGYVEAVGATMWFGEGFWNLVPGRPEDVQCEEWLRVSTPCEGIMRIDAADRPFESAAGAEGELQRRLRKLLFHQ